MNLAHTLIDLQHRLAGSVAQFAEGLSANPEVEQKQTSRLLGTPRHVGPLALRVRVAAFAVALILSLFMGLKNLEALYGLAGLFGIYTLLLWRFPILNDLARGSLAFTMDGAFVAAASALTGAPDSPFMAVYPTLLAFHLVRFGARQLLYALSLCALFIGVATLAQRPEPAQVARMFFWDFWLLVIGLATALLAERSRRAESDLATDVRRTRTLLQAAHAPAASPTLDGVLAAILSEARGLTGAEMTAVRLYARGHQPSIYRDDVPPGPEAEQFRHLVRSYGRRRFPPPRRGRVGEGVAPPATGGSPPRAPAPLPSPARRAWLDLWSSPDGQSQISAPSSVRPSEYSSNGRPSPFKMPICTSRSILSSTSFGRSMAAC